LLNVGQMSLSGLFYTFVVTIMLFFIGLLVFNKTEKSFIDTV
jgi:lipopolysaccharide transport system permease protein